MSEMPDPFREMIRGLPGDDPFREEHRQKVRALAMAEFDQAEQGTAGTASSRLGLAKRYLIGGALAASLLIATGGGTFYLARSMQGESYVALSPAEIEKMKRDRMEVQLAASLRTIESFKSDDNPDAHDRAVAALWNWHLSRAAESP